MASVPAKDEDTKTNNRSSDSQGRRVEARLIPQFERPPFRYWISEEARGAGASFTSPREGDAGFDLRAAISLSISPGEQTLVPTGLFCAIPVGWVGIIKDRSSVALRGIHTHAGVIDASYRGEVKIVIVNRSGEPFLVEAGTKIAQMVVVPHLGDGVEVSSLEELGQSIRGCGGFGSTGR
jgi:dUTP pyrophosphatase